MCGVGCETRPSSGLFITHFSVALRGCGGSQWRTFVLCCTPSKHRRPGLRAKRDLAMRYCMHLYVPRGKPDSPWTIQTVSTTAPLPSHNHSGYQTSDPFSALQFCLRYDKWSERALRPASLFMRIQEAIGSHDQGAICVNGITIGRGMV